MLERCNCIYDHSAKKWCIQSTYHSQGGGGMEWKWLKSPPLTCVHNAVLLNIVTTLELYLRVFLIACHLYFWGTNLPFLRFLDLDILLALLTDTLPGVISCQTEIKAMFTSITWRNSLIKAMLTSFWAFWNRNIHAQFTDSWTLSTSKVPLVFCHIC